MFNNLKKIVLIGPESTGKSTLCHQLASHFNTLWVPEHAREYLLKNGTDYTVDDLLIIAKNQLLCEDETITQLSSADHSSRIPLLFIDTDMYVMKVWSEYVFNQCHTEILNGIVNRKYDLYLLCEPDIPWVKDELREYPDLDTRHKLYHHYKDALIHQHTPWIVVSGDYENRFEMAKNAVNQMMNRL